MKNYLTKSKSTEELNTLEHKDFYSPGEYYPEIFKKEKDLEFREDMLMEIGIIWLGAYKLQSSFFEKVKCPICKKETLIPYSCIASILSGAHILKFHCLSCKEHFATNDMSDYYHTIRDYILENRQHLTPIKGKCTSLGQNSIYVKK